MRRAVGLLVRIGLVATVGVSVGAPVGAEVLEPGRPRSTGGGPNTELIFDDIFPGLVGEPPGETPAILGFVPPAGDPFDPITSGYPDADPVGWDAHNPMYAGLIVGVPVGGGDPLLLYCIRLGVATGPGVGYESATWDESNVPNVGYVTQLLNRYFPVTGAPADLASDDERAAAVQAAIWFFTDRYVVSTDDPLRAAVEAIVDDVLAAGPVAEPAPPQLEISPSSNRGPVDSPLGPYTVSVATPPGTAVVSATGATMIDGNGDPIPNDSEVATGTEIFLESDTPGDAVLSARASMTVPGGTVYVYDGNTPGMTTAQSLILADQGTVSTVRFATGEFFQTGALSVTKTIAGPGAGRQGEVVIDVECGGVPLEPRFVIPPGTTGSVTQTYEGIEVGVTCIVTETVNGSNSVVSVVVTPALTVPIPGEGSAAATITNTYTLQPTTTTTTTMPRATTTTAPSRRPLAASGGGSLGIPIGLGAIALGCVLYLIALRMEPGPGSDRIDR